ncbi:MAG: M48 family metalloprotease [Alphaproteobacteria bacterium]|nr:M48 family metalloprotease [Alphaproteobacteria bacterium]
MTCMLMMQAHAAFALAIIRDVEEEMMVREIIDPILLVAGIGPQEVKIFLVNDKQVNAYVAGGMNIFIHTGLLVLKDDPEVLSGVMAHEIGHIAGGHINKTDSDLQGLSVESALTYLLGIAAIAAGAPAAGQAIVMGGQHMLQRHVLKYSRSHEDAADQSALTYLSQLNISPRGLFFVLNYLSKDATQQFGQLDPYLQTHPLSRERVSHIQHYMDMNQKQWKPMPEDFRRRYAMAIAKLKAYVQPAQQTLREYPLADQSPKALYARAIAYFKKPYFEKSMGEIDKLMKLDPKNPFYPELKGQILLENGRVEEALPFYEKANTLVSHPLMKLEWAMALIAAQDRNPEKISYLIAAGPLLEKVLLEEPENSLAWYQQGIAYGRRGMLGQSYMSFAEEAMLKNKTEQAQKYLVLADKNLADGSPLRLRLADMKDVLKERSKKAKK